MNLSFNDFLQESQLKESLDSQVEFYMTDDTKLPNEIYAAYQSEGTDYGISILKSNWDGIYMLDLYYLKNNKKIHWKFKNQKDLKVGLSTAIKVFESSLPFIGAKMNGLLIELRHKQEAQKYTKMLQRVIKKSHIKSFKLLEATKTNEKALNFTFMIRNGVKPEVLFKSAKFSKSYDFGEAMEQVDYKKKPKPTASLEKSDKFAFEKIKIDITTPEEMVDMLDLATAQFKEDGSLKLPDGPEENEVLPEFRKVSIEIGSSNQNVEVSKDQVKVKLAVMLAFLMPAAYENIKLHGFDESKVDFNNMGYAMNGKYNMLPDNFKKELSLHIDINDLGSDSSKTRILHSLERFKDVETVEVKKLYKILEEELGKENTINNADSPKSSVSDKFTGASKLNLGFEVKSDVEGYGPSNDSVAKGANGSSTPFREKNENVTKKMETVWAMKEVTEWLIKDKSSKGKFGYSALKDYTGSEYGGMNSQIRKATKKGDLVFTEFTSKVQNLAKYFVSDAPKLDAGIWVYRNCHIPGDIYEAGEDIVDSAFLSTSVRSTISIGSGGNSKLKIFLPKGTKCFPMFEESEHPGENEIVLPPLAMLRVIETDLYNDKMCYTCVMLGSGVESLVKGGDKNIMA